MVVTDQIKTWPTQPGVYIMKDVTGRILYVGKAKNLRNRIRSYFQDPEKLTPKTRVLVKKIFQLEFTVTHTELEALLLECNLIKKHRPRYNVRLKDDKNYPYVVLDFTHPFPQFRVTRKITPSPALKYFGPFSGGIREISRFLLKTFQIRDCSDSKFKNRRRPCLNYEIGTCTAPCVDYVSQTDYAKQVEEAILFLRGKKQALVQNLKKQMQEASERWEYEKAKNIRDKIAAIDRITEKQNAVLTEKQRDIDVVGVFESDQELSIAVLFIRNGFLTGRRTVKLPLTLDSTEQTILEFLQQFYLVSLVPDEIWLATDFEERLLLEKMLIDRAQKKVSIRVPRTEQPLRLLGMAYENAKLIYLDQKNKTTISGAEELQRVLDLPEIPQTIEGIDVSNLQGKNPAIALVHFSDERPLKSRYRLYYPKTVEGQNDFAMIHEVVTRRFKKPDPPPPDLLLIDGGKGQLASAERALKDLGVEIPVLALAKSRTQSAFTRKQVERTEERIFVPNRKNPIVLKETNPALRLLQQVRDEAHRFSIESHRRRRSKTLLDESVLKDIPGIGEATRLKLLKNLGSLSAISEANFDSLIGAGLNRSQAQAVLDQISQKTNEEE
ncbi:MAG: excinuclease ABC subunit UvrC [Pseudomonadota bacterium]